MPRKAKNVEVDFLGNEIVEEKPIEHKEAGMSLWDYIKCITTTKQSLTDEELKGYDPFMINRWLSCVHMYIPQLADACDSTMLGNKMMHYEFLRNSIPKKNVFIDRKNYVKLHQPKDLKELIELITTNLELGTNDVMSAIDHLGYDAVNTFADRFRNPND